MSEQASLLDQSALTALAERLVDAARRAGADAADAVAVRSVSLSVEIRDGAVDESERAEGDDVGLRVLVGRRQAVVSTNDIAGADIAALAERAVAMARAAPDDAYAGLADADRLAKGFPQLDLVDSDLPTVAQNAFSRIARAVEISLFGGRSIDSDAWAACRSAYAELTVPKNWARA